MKDRIFITGGLGFIGSHLVRRLVRDGYAVRIYDNYSSGLVERIADVRNSVEIIRGNILDVKTLTRAMKGADIVSHHAAQLEITSALKNPYFDLTTNTTGTLNVLEACVKNKVKKLINASSACVYGQTDGTPSVEDGQTNPNWAYGISKLAGEKYCSIYSGSYNLPVVSFRYAIIYGPDEWYGRVMTICIKRAIEGKPLIIFGNGRQTRDFTHVNEVIEANMKAIGKHRHGHEIFNVSTGVGTSITQLAVLISKISGKHPEIIYDKKVAEGEVSRFIHRVRIPNELNHLVLSPAKLKRIWNVRPLISLTEGVKQQMKWVENHTHRWKKMSY
jgi:UDP-glucose 4-epimerase